MLTCPRGHPSPLLLGTGAHEAGPWLALEWCDGVPILVAAAEHAARPATLGSTTCALAWWRRTPRCTSAASSTATSTQAMSWSTARVQSGCSTSVSHGRSITRTTRRVAASPVLRPPLRHRPAGRHRSAGRHGGVRPVLARGTPVPARDRNAPRRSRARSRRAAAPDRRGRTGPVRPSGTPTVAGSRGRADVAPSDRTRPIASTRSPTSPPRSRRRNRLMGMRRPPSTTRCKSSWTTCWRVRRRAGRGSNWGSARHRARLPIGQRDLPSPSTGSPRSRDDPRPAGARRRVGGEGSP